MKSKIGWNWVGREVRDYATEEILECWAATVPGLRYPRGEPVVIEAMHTSMGWWAVGDSGGAFASRTAPNGVIGTLLAHLEKFVAVEMTGDCHFYVQVEAEPKRTLTARIEKAANLVAAYSAVLAHVHAPPEWPPQISIVMTQEQAVAHGLMRS